MHSKIAIDLDHHAGCIRSLTPRAKTPIPIPAKPGLYFFSPFVQSSALLLTALESGTCLCGSAGLRLGRRLVLLLLLELLLLFLVLLFQLPLVRCLLRIRLGNRLEEAL